MVTPPSGKCHDPNKERKLEKIGGTDELTEESRNQINKKISQIDKWVLISLRAKGPFGWTQ